MAAPLTLLCKMHRRRAPVCLMILSRTVGCSAYFQTGLMLKVVRSAVNQVVFRRELQPNSNRADQLACAVRAATRLMDLLMSTARSCTVLAELLSRLTWQASCHSLACMHQTGPCYLAFLCIRYAGDL